MTFSPAEIKWLDAVSGKTKGNPTTPEDVTAALEAEAKRKEFLDGALAKTIGRNADFIAKAQDFSIRNPKKGAKGLWAKIVGGETTEAMQWKVAPGSLGSGFEIAADHEVDTVADISEETEEIPADVIKAAHDAIASILEAQNHMLRQFDQAGNRLFTDEDIRRELWTPLVRQGVIPENMVPDRFSEEAQAFKGATQIYEDRLADYTETTTGREGALKALRITKDVVEFVGTVGVSGASMANASTVAPLEEEMKKLKKTPGFDKDSLAAIELQDKIDEAKKGETIATSVKAMSMTTLSLAETMVKKGKYKGQPGYALDVVREVVKSADTLIGSAVSVGFGDDGDMIAKSIQAAVKGVNIGGKLMQIGSATTDEERIAQIKELIGEVADAVGTAMSAYGSKLKSQDKVAGKKFTDLSSTVTSYIKDPARAVTVYEKLKKGDAEGAVKSLFTGALESAIEKEYTADGGLSDGMEGVRNTGIYKMDQKLFAEVEEALLKEQEAKEKEAKEKLDRELAEAFADEEKAAALFAEWDKDVEAMAETYAEANPTADLDDLEPEAAEEAIAAIERAMAATNAIRARAELINTVTSAGAAVIASFVPGAGAVTAAQKVAYDIYLLTRAVDMHNKWVDSMEIAFRANSAYASAIQKTLTNAKITLSQKSVKLVLDSLQLGAQVGRCFDPTGAATAVSAGITMTSALVDFGYKMHKEVEIVRAWKAYCEARENPRNRKAARKAMRMNSTLAKCAIAYGACMGNDASAKQAIQISGLSPEILTDDKDVCKRLVTYLENELKEDAVVEMALKSARPWHPASQPLLSPGSWFEFKAAAMRAAVPPLAPSSARTPAIDQALGDLHKAWQGETSQDKFSVKLAVIHKPDDTILKTEGQPEKWAQLGAGSEAAIPALETLLSAFAAYEPKAFVNNKETGEHAEMAAVVKVLLFATRTSLATARADAERAKSIAEQVKEAAAKAKQGDGGKSNSGSSSKGKSKS